MKLSVTSTSFLLPGNQSWQALSDKHEVGFGDYGNWPVALREKSQEALLWVIFLEDVVPMEALWAQATPSSDSIRALLEPVLQSLSSRLAASKATTLIAWSAWRKESPIRPGKQPTPWQQLCRAFSAELEHMAAEFSSLYLMDLDSFFAEIGLDTCFDSRNFYLTHCRLSSKGLSMLAITASVILERISNAAKKVLVLDCDNTLWGGVVGEVGLSGLTLGQDGLGQAFVDFQRTALGLAREGILLAIASKNNEEDVWEVFDRHSAMALKKSDITIAHINWQDKASNIKTMVQDMDLGIDSFVFWDDNPLEREKVRAQIPQLLVPEVPDDVMLWPKFLNSMNAFARFTVTSEDRKKTEQYKSRSDFVSSQRTARDETEFLKSIALEPRAFPIGASSLSRAAQLCAKTNQFNLRTIRYTETELAGMAQNPGALAFMVHLKDKFGDHGNVGLLIAYIDVAPKTAFLDTFLISCRVLGRHLKSWMLGELKNQLHMRGIEWLLAERRPTAKNIVAQDFLAGHGLLPFSEAQNIQAPVQEAANTLCTGERFLVSLNHWTIPHLSAYNHD